jgi:hypothetical protein
VSGPLALPLTSELTEPALDRHVLVDSRDMMIASVYRKDWAEALVLVCNSHEKLAAIAERFAGACKECDGKGFIEIPDTCDTSYCEDNTQTFPCEACLDIRDVLASLKEQP